MTAPVARPPVSVIQLRVREWSRRDRLRAFQTVRRPRSLKRTHPAEPTVLDRWLDFSA